MSEPLKRALTYDITTWSHWCGGGGSTDEESAELLDRILSRIAEGDDAVIEAMALGWARHVGYSDAEIGEWKNLSLASSKPHWVHVAGNCRAALAAAMRAIHGGTDVTER